MSDFYIGQIMLFAFDFAPRGFMPCNGQLLSIAQNQALFSILGTTYGGDGRVTFGLPDLRGCVMVSAGQGPGRSNYGLGQRGGAETATLNIGQLPSHTHAVTASTATMTANNSRPESTSPVGAVLALSPDLPIYTSTPDASTTLNPAASVLTVTLAATGGNQAVPTMMPYLAVGYCICTQGLFPSRN
jgi:microcystin-dependent protein